MVCIRCSELIYRYRNETPCALLVRSCRRSWWTSFLGHPAPCSARYYEPLTFILFEGTQLIEKIRECTRFPTIQVHTQTSPPGLCILIPQCIPMSNANFHEFLTSLKVCSAARHLVHSFKVLLDSCISRLIFPSHSVFPTLGDIPLVRGLTDACLSGINCDRYHPPHAWVLRCYDIRIPRVRANYNVVLMHFLRRRIRLLLFFMLRHGRYRRRTSTICLQAPIVYIYGYSIAFDHPREYISLVLFVTFEIEDILPSTSPALYR